MAKHKTPAPAPSGRHHLDSKPCAFTAAHCSRGHRYVFVAFDGRFRCRSCPASLPVVSWPPHRHTVTATQGAQL